MRINKNTYLAVECLVRLASQEDAGPCTAQSLAQRINRSDAYMELILAKLRTAGLVRSIRGPRGGYLLSRAARTISVAEILIAMEDWSATPAQPKTIGSAGEQTAERLDGLTVLWQCLTGHVCGYLEKVFVSDLVPRTDAQQGGVE
jgi:Rrf2 family iron-sulfur cluster assembly transcriptional regulator